ncbi:unnamed protein product [Hydatigera taeniaeformis]|uniref:ANK_REP_REGION domain-containing protein n=1 Tax=Hydatigena taeniaeformis TaxID=6205 RepID=A0A0R3WV76_HYDTA|nr:unnamed protein product [Hydatigera taeniaeformis]
MGNTATTFCCQADPNVDAEERSSTPLIAATASGNIEMMQLLLENGACTYFCDHHGNTPLHWAAMKGNMAAVNLLCRYDSTTNLQNKRHRTPIIEARCYGHHDVVQYLLRAEHTDAASKVDESGHTRVPATTTTTATLMASNAQSFSSVCPILHDMLLLQMHATATTPHLC